MNRGRILLTGITCLAAIFITLQAAAQEKYAPMVKMEEAKFSGWLARWEKNITDDSRNRYCDKALGEDIGWLMMPFMDGFYYGYLATKNAKWIDLEFNWADSLINRAVKEPDGYRGWPKAGGAGTEVDNLNSFTTDSLLGEAMVLRPLVLLSSKIIKTPALKEKYGVKAEGYIKLAEQVFEKWNERGSWRDTGDGKMMTVVLPFGIDPVTGQWTAGYEKRNSLENGFSDPNNKANYVARWLLAMYDVTKKPVYKERAEKWFRLLKSRMKLKEDGTYTVWNYWEPAGPWDYKKDGSPKHWVGVHPNEGYYQIDLESIVDAYNHGLVFTKEDINNLIATALATKRYWNALVPFSADIQKEFEAAVKPDSWVGLAGAAKYLMLQTQMRAPVR
jgi:hypothetical protein